MADIPVLPGIPAVTPVTDQTIASILRPMKESIEILGAMVNGTPLPNGQVISTGIQALTAVSTTPSTSSYDPLTDYTPPPAPTGVSIMGAFTNIIVSWAEPTYQNHAYTEVWRSTTNVLSTASLIGFAPGAVYTDSVANNSTYYYWVRFVSKANITGPYNSFVGLVGQTALDPAYVLSVLSGQITQSQLFSDLSSRINLIDSPPSVPGSVNARLSTEATNRITADTALQTSITTLQATVSTNNTNLNAAIQTEATARANADTALSSSITTLQSTVTSNNNTLTAAVQTEASTRASVDGGLLAQYTVKVDVNGRVAGFGLASTTSGGTPSSSFVIIADKFAVVSPYNTGETPSVPFAIGTVDGVTRVAMTNAFIQDAAITNAKIANLAVDSAKIANAAVGTAKIANASITTALIADANITTAKIADANITTAKIANAAIGTAQIADASITAAKIVNASITNAQIANATIVAANIADGNITNAKIANAAIDSAKIQDGQITNAKIAYAAIDSSKIIDANITNAKIADAAITNAKIGTAEVSTLKIQGNAVTIPVAVTGELDGGYNIYASLNSSGAPKLIQYRADTYFYYSYAGNPDTGQQPVVGTYTAELYRYTPSTGWVSISSTSVQAGNIISLLDLDTLSTVETVTYRITGSAIYQMGQILKPVNNTISVLEVKR